MKVRTMMLLALAVTVAATSVAAAESKRVRSGWQSAQRTSRTGSSSSLPYIQETLKHDSGKATITFRDAGKVMRQGQSVSLYNSTFIFREGEESHMINERSAVGRRFERKRARLRFPPRCRDRHLEGGPRHGTVRADRRRRAN